MAASSAANATTESGTIIKTPDQLTDHERKKLDFILHFYGDPPNHVFDSLIERDCYDRVIFDSPAIYAKGKDEVKALMLYAKKMFEFIFKPEYLRVPPIGHGGTGSIEAVGKLTIKPRALNLLPDNVKLSLPLQGLTLDWSVQMHWFLHSGKVHTFKEVLHNLPGAPTLFRKVWGTMFGTMGALSMMVPPLKKVMLEMRLQDQMPAPQAHVLST